MFNFCASVILFNPDKSVLISIKTYSSIFSKVFVIDNSLFNNSEVISEIIKMQNIELIKFNSNRGISSALNVAFNKAIEENYDFILTMDQDSIYDANNIWVMLEFINKNHSQNIGIYASNFCRIFDDSNKNNGLSKPRYKISTLKPVLAAITSGSFVSINALKKILPLDENYFIANVDIDLSAQMYINDYKVFLVGSSLLYQQVGGSVKKSTISELLRFTNYSSTRYYYQVRNSFYLINKYKTLWNFKAFGYLQLLKYIFKICTSEKNKFEKIKFSYLGYLDYKKGIFGKKVGID